MKDKTLHPIKQRVLNEDNTQNLNFSILNGYITLLLEDVE